MSKTGATWTFTYDANGMRTSRSSQYTTYEYVYNGGKLMQMTSQGTTAGATAYVFNFFYDASGVPTSFTMNGATYYYVTNLQGDVVAIVDSSGVKTASYSYDAWGNVTFKKGSGTNSNFITYYNPLLYRSYVYDQESQLYYLQSRYYDPEVGRFINADALVSTGQDILGNNMFAYCGNNPVNYDDTSGNHHRSIGADIRTVYIDRPGSRWNALAELQRQGKNAPLVMDMAVSYQVPGTPFYLKGGVAFVMDFENCEMDLYFHGGGGIGYSSGISVSAGIVSDYSEPGDYAGFFSMLMLRIHSDLIIAGIQVNHMIVQPKPLQLPVQLVQVVDLEWISIHNRLKLRIGSDDKC